MNTDAIGDVLSRVYQGTESDRQSVNDALMELAAIKDALRWRDVREELPELHVEVLVLFETNCDMPEAGRFALSSYDDTLNSWWIESRWIPHELHSWIIGVTHWMPLLPGPEEASR